MTAKVTDELRREIDREKGAPVHLVDVEQQKEYVLIPAEAYQRVLALFGGGDPFDIRETYAVQDQAADEAWSHPDDAAYDHYDLHRRKQ
jgi:hypothetical protein